jgi:trehalose 6-phosphate phosphatase
VIPEPTLGVLEGLAGLPSVVVALLTGRDLDSLQRMERLEGIWRAVEHGGVVLAPGEPMVERTLSESQREALERFREWTAKNAEGAFIEHKPQSIAVHVRGVAERDPQRANRILAEADALAAALGLHVRRGKALREAETVPHDKGNALDEIRRRSGAASVFFAGDDITDFPAIRLASERGIGVFVRSDERRETPAENAIVLDGVEQLGDVLRELCIRLDD